MGEYSLKLNVHYGPQKLNEVGLLCRPLGKYACIVADSFFRGGEALATIKRELAQQGIKSVCFSDVRSDPDCEDVDCCVKLILKSGCDFVIALGGGSCIDTAKAAALTAKNGGLCWEYCSQILPNGQNGSIRRPLKGALPIVAIPTTAGSGSEADRGCVISNRALSVKSGIGDDSLFPSVSIVDPCLMTALPKMQTAYTGFDAFSHAFESFLLNTTTCFSEAIALESMRLFHEGYLAAVRDGQNLAAREKMANASTLAGVNIALTDTSVGHVLGQPLSALFHMVHGATLAVTLDSIAEWLLPEATEKLARVAEILDPSLVGFPQREKARRLPDILRAIKREAGIDQCLGDFGVKEDDVQQILDYVEAHVGLSSPILTEYAKAPTKADLEQILLASF